MDEIKVEVSPVIRQGGQQKIFISFVDSGHGREAEAVMPGGVFIKNTGFSDNELDVFKEYLIKEQENIFNTAKTINPLAEFFGKRNKS
ncbi:MAG: hypothetical protein ACTTKP_09755 [Catonella sp.]|uniref:hypothetical protein n=1 Tax=Catonella sp. TaxID=2382125 RepID=UPI003FA138AA